MTSRRPPHALFTEQEYWAMEESSLIHHEYFEGEVLALPDKSPTHIDIAGDIAAALHNLLLVRPCRARMSDQRIKVEATSLQTYPDVVVVCPPFRFEPNNQITLLDAMVIVEVLSDSTRQYDQNEKFRNYRQLPSLRHYLLVETESVSIEHRRRLENGDWETQTFSSLIDEIELDAIACTLRTGTVYRGLNMS